MQIATKTNTTTTHIHQYYQQQHLQKKQENGKKLGKIINHFRRNCLQWATFSNHFKRN